MSHTAPADAAEAFRIRNVMLSGETIASYAGPVNDELLAGLGAVLKTRMSAQGTDRHVVRSVFAVLVEQVQNIMRYSSEVCPDVSVENGVQTLRDGLIRVGRTADGSIFVSCSNLLDDTQIDALRTTLERLRGLDRKALTSLMGDILFDDHDNSERGGGVGWITIAREANGCFGFDFYPVGASGRSYFNFTAFFEPRP